MQRFLLLCGQLSNSAFSTSGRTVPCTCSILSKCILLGWSSLTLTGQSSPFRDLSSFGYEAIQQLEEMESAERVHMAHLALSGKATWHDAASCRSTGQWLSFCCHSGG